MDLLLPFQFPSCRCLPDLALIAVPAALLSCFWC
jgi:hypothetical protein